MTLIWSGAPRFDVMVCDAADRRMMFTMTSEKSPISNGAAGRPSVVVITGASAGVGRATAIAFAQCGARIGLLARGRDGLEATRRDVESCGSQALVVPTDVADANQVEQAADAVERELGPIDIWINNAMTSVF